MNRQKPPGMKLDSEQSRFGSGSGVPVCGNFSQIPMFGPLVIQCLELLLIRDLGENFVSLFWIEYKKTSIMISLLAPSSS